MQHDTNGSVLFLLKSQTIYENKIMGVLILLFIGLGACKYDDEALWDKLASLEERIASLEDQLSQMNSDISAMSTIVNALENQISISKVEETEDGLSLIHI